MPRRLIVIHNPSAGQRRRRRTEAVLALLRAAGCALDLRATARAGDAKAIAADITADDADAVVAAGGDGTVNEVVNGLLAAPRLVPPLAILPLGTANVLAAEIGLGTTPAAIAATILDGRPRSVHVGRANGRYFVLMASVGLDAHVVANVRLAVKRHAGKLAYVGGALAGMLRYPYPVCRVKLDGEPHAVRAVVVCNGRLYGGRFVAAPAASLETPDFEVLLLERGGAWNALRYMTALALGQLPRLPDVRTVTARHVRIDGANGAPVQADGDVVTRLPAEFVVADRRLDLIYPPAPANIRTSAFPRPSSRASAP